MTSAGDKVDASRGGKPPGGRPGPVAVSLSGGFRLVLDGDPVELPGGVQRLVALLALRGPMSRSSLAGTLWPETDENRALARLRTAIWRVKKGVPELILSVGSRIDLAAQVEVDIREQIDRSMRVLHGTAVDPRSWTSSVPDGDLLPDWEDEWLTDDRERLRQLRLHVLEDLVEQFCAKGRFGLAVDAALTVLRADVLRESAHRALLRVYLAEGNIVEARRAYQACVDVFQRELGVHPTPAISALLTPRPTMAPSHTVPSPARAVAARLR